MKTKRESWRDQARDLLWRAYYDHVEGAREVLLDLLEEKAPRATFLYARKFLASPAFRTMSTSSLAFQRLERKIVGSWRDQARDLLWRAYYDDVEGAREVLLDLLKEKAPRTTFLYARKFLASPAFRTMSTSSLAFQRLERKIVGHAAPSRRHRPGLSYKAAKKVLLVRVNRARENWVNVGKDVVGDFAWRERPWLVSVGSGYSVWYFLAFAPNAEEALAWVADAKPHLVYDEVEEGDADEDEAEYVENAPWPSKLGRMTDQLDVERVQLVRTARVTGYHEGVFADGSSVTWVE